MLSDPKAKSNTSIITDFKKSKPSILKDVRFQSVNRNVQPTIVSKWLYLKYIPKAQNCRIAAIKLWP